MKDKNATIRGAYMDENLSDLPAIRYVIDKQDRIRSVNQAFLDFGRDNDWQPEPSSLINRSLFDFVVGQEVCVLMDALFRRVRETTKTVSIPFRCDSSNFRRYMTMRISTFSHGELTFDNILLDQQPRAAVDLSAIAPSSKDNCVSMCSWCNRIALDDGQWVEAEVAIDKKTLFADTPPSVISHGLCSDCDHRLTQTG
jgi:hypothetical protein